MSVIDSPVTALQRKPDRGREAVVIPPELVSEAAQIVFQVTEMLKSRTNREGYFISKPSEADSLKMEAASLHAGQAAEAVEGYDPEFSDVCGTLEDPDGEYHMAEGTALTVIKALRRYRKEDVRRKSTSGGRTW
jgi:hypothetical protein